MQSLLKIILSLIILALSYPTARMLYRLTKDEKKLYKKYFPKLNWLLLVLAAIFYFINLIWALTLSFMFLVIFFWNKN